MPPPPVPGRNRSIALFLTANIISGFAQGISMLAIPWYFTGVAGKASLFGALYAITTFFSLFWNLYAGTLIDRFPRKNIFIWVSLVCGVILLGSAFTAYHHEHLLIFLAGLVFVTTMFNYNIHYGALYAFGQELSQPSQYGKISSYLEIQNQATSVLSGTFAALLLTGVTEGESLNIAGFNIVMPFSFMQWQMADIFLLNGITYLAAILVVSLIRYRAGERMKVETESMFLRIREGWLYLKKNPALFAFGNYSYSIFVVLMVQVFLLLPLYVNQQLHRGSDVFASAEIFYSLGAMLAGIFVRRLFGGANTVNSIIILMIMTTIGFYVVAFTQVVGIYYFFSFLIGITNAGARVLRTTFIFTHVSNDIIGRTNGVFNVINILLRSFFLLLFSLAWFSTGNNIIWAYVICGTFVLLSGVALLRKRRQLDSLHIHDA